MTDTRTNKFDQWDKYDTTDERIVRPKVARFRQTTVHKPRNTRRDKLAAARLVADLEG